MVCACNAQDPAPAEPLDGRFNRLFDRAGGGWTGGDGTYSVVLPDGRSVWLFGDTFLDTVGADGRRAPGSRLINNSLVVQDGDSLRTLYGGTAAEPAAWLRPPVADQWYWPLDGFVAGERLYLFFSAFERVGEGIWSFSYTGRDDMAVLRLPGLELEEVVNVDVSQIAYGAAVMEDAGYIYIYGLEDLSESKFMHLARVGAADPKATWQYWVDGAWSADPPRSQRLLEGVSNQYSVLSDGDAYRLITQTYPFGRDIVEYRAPAPHGPWEGPRLLYTVPDPGGNLYTYNAVAHPQFGDDRGLLVSYNVNSFVFADLFEDAGIYRPRFVRLF